TLPRDADLIGCDRRCPRAEPAGYIVHQRSNVRIGITFAETATPIRCHKAAVHDPGIVPRFTNSRAQSCVPQTGFHLYDRYRHLGKPHQ
ncbi:MAG: hypothetical protein ACREXR_17870, partial [Gammaproteobacteria bacterium]